MDVVVKAGATGARLSRADYLQVVRNTPLIAFDLLIPDAEGRYLVGLRHNAPARGTWFVPGGVIRKGESLDGAFARIVNAECGVADARRSDALWLGLYEHHYAENFADAAGIATHYVVLAHALPVLPVDFSRTDDQHADYRWLTPRELLADPAVHANTKAYFTESGLRWPEVTRGKLERP